MKLDSERPAPASVHPMQGFRVSQTRSTGLRAVRKPRDNTDPVIESGPVARKGLSSELRPVVGGGLNKNLCMNRARRVLQRFSL